MAAVNSACCFCNQILLKLMAEFHFRLSNLNFKINDVLQEFGQFYIWLIKFLGENRNGFVFHIEHIVDDVCVFVPHRFAQ